MSLKVKLATTIAALCMVICLLTVGVWAATKTSVNVSGTVSFVAEDVNATISATVTGATGDEQNITNKVIATFLGDEVIPEGSDYYEYEDKDGNKTYDFKDLDFASKDSVIVITLTIKNDSTQRKLNVDSFTATLGTGTPTKLTADVPAEDAKETFAGSNVVAWISQEAPTTKIAPEGTATVAISLRVANTNLKVNAAPFAATLQLSNAGEYVPEGE